MTEATTREDRGWNLTALAIDLLSACLLTAALSHAAIGILAIEHSLAQGALLASCCALSAFACTRRWWILPSAVAVVATATALMLLLYDGSEELIAHWQGLIGWIWAGMPPRVPYSYNGSFWIVKAAVVFPIAMIAFAFVRKFFSFAALCATAGTVVIALFFLRPEILDAVLALFSAVLIITLPRLACRWIRRDGGTGIPRWSMQIIGIPAALLCVLLSLAVVPQGGDVWRNQTLSRFVGDIQDVIDYYWGTPGNTAGTAIGSYGFMPLAHRLGGDIDPEPVELLSVQTETPVYLRASVYDTYDGKNWYDGEAAGSFRLGSIFWRSRRVRAFGGYLPSGGREAAELYGMITSDVAYRITTLRGRMHSYLIGSDLVSIDALPGRSALFPYFSDQGEVFERGGAETDDSYRVTATRLDRTLSGFEENLRALLSLTAGSDRHYPEIERRYRTVYEGFPEDIRTLALDIVEGFDDGYGKAAAIERWLGEHCAYSMTPGTPPEEQDFIAHFLDTGEGYCTYYATAMTVMARCAGLPARYVTGFGLKKEQDGEADRYAVLVSSAHAWCEIYFEGVGWMIFDPLSWDMTYPDEEPPEPAQAHHEPTPAELEPEAETGPDAPPPHETLPSVAQPRKRSIALPIAAATLILLAALLLGYHVLMGRRFARYALDRVMRRYRGDDRRVAFYFTDIMRQMTFWHVVMEPGETLTAYCARCDRYVKIGHHGMRRVGEIVARSFYGGKKLSRDEFRTLFFVHDDLETLLRGELGTLRYFLLRALS